MNWQEWINYLTHPQAEHTIWVLIGVPVAVLLLNYAAPQIMEWRAYRKTHPMSRPTADSKPKKNKNAK